MQEDVINSQTRGTKIKITMHNNGTMDIKGYTPAPKPDEEEGSEKKRVHSIVHRKAGMCRQRDLYDTFDDVPLEYCYPFQFHDKEYLSNNNASTYTWDYQDTVNIDFEVDCKYRQYLLRATIYNFRGEAIFQTSDYVDEYNVFHLNIDHTISTNFFTKGTYSCQIQAFYPLNEEDDYVVTIMPKEVCTFYVR